MKTIISFIGFFIIIGAAWSQEGAQFATLVTYKGEVKLNQKRLSTGDENIPISQGAILEAVGKKSFFIIQYKDGSRFMVKDGHIKVEKLEAKNTLLSLVKGSILSYVNPKSRQQFKVKTKRASFAVRGTKFWVQESAKESYLCVCEGQVAVRNNNALMLVNPGEDSHIKNRIESLRKQHSAAAMWSMASKGFKTMGLNISFQPK